MIKKIFLSLRTEGIRSIFKKAYFRIDYSIYRVFNSNRIEEDRWKLLKGKFKGHRAFLIGNGPSLNKTPLYLLKNEHVMTFNRFYVMKERLNWSSQFYMCVDNLVLKDLVSEIPDIVKDTELSFFPDRHFRKVNFKNLIGVDEKFFWLEAIFGRGFSKNLPKVHQGGSVIYEGMQVLDYLGFDEIILLGVDMNFSLHTTAENLNSAKGTDIRSLNDDDPNHFDPRYFGKGRSYHQPRKFVIDNIVSSLDYLGENLKSYNLSIVNCGFDSKVEAFPKKSLFDILGMSKVEIRDLFNELLKSKSGFSIEEFESNFCFFDHIDQNTILDKNFYTTEQLGYSYVKKLIEKFLPLGPWDGRYYFILRNI